MLGSLAVGEAFDRFHRGEIGFDDLADCAHPFLVCVIRRAGCEVNEDTLQVARIALYLTTLRFQYERGAFTSYLAYAVANEVRRWVSIASTCVTVDFTTRLRLANGTEEEREILANLNHPITVDPHEMEQLARAVLDPGYEQVEERLECDRLCCFLQSTALSPAEHVVLVLAAGLQHDCYPRTCSEIARLLQVPKGVIRRLLRRAVRKVRRAFQTEQELRRAIRNAKEVRYERPKEVTGAHRRPAPTLPRTAGGVLHQDV